jgi:aerobic carbon-monoxide dehydrogenase large subunit
LSVLGNTVRRGEDVRFITGAATYADDVPLEGALHATFVRSVLPHARVRGVDAGELEGRPGTRVFTAADLDLDPLAPPNPMINEAMARPIMAGEVVRFTGEVVAAVVTEDRLEGPDAAELVAVDFEELPAVADVQAALAAEEPLFGAAGTNVAVESGPDQLDDQLFDGCEVVVSTSFRSQRLASCPLECRAAAAVWDEDGRLTAWVGTQTPNRARDALAAALGVEAEAVRVVVPDVGGGFGPKSGIGVEEILVAWLARRLDRPVRWVEERSENMLALPHGRAQEQELTIGGSRDGKVEAFRLQMVQDAGAYPALGAILPTLTGLCSSGNYAIPRIEVAFQSVVTNTTPIVAYRGAGRPEAIQAIERAMDVFAAELELDPADVRRRNLIPADAFPYKTAAGATYDSGDYTRALDLVLERAGYGELREEQRRRREEGGPFQLGIGLAMYIEVTNPLTEPEWANVEITPEGGARVLSGLGPTGQGHETALAMLVGDRLGIPMESITVITGDTELVPRGTGTYGSRSLQVGGSAVDGAATRVLERARELAAEELEAAAADVHLDPETGAFHVAGVAEPSLSWGQLAGSLASAERLEELSLEFDFEPKGIAWPFGAHLAVVDVDTETGKVTLRRMVCVDDCGRVLNPLLAEGQRHGGIAQGVAQALGEEFAYDEEANPLTDNFVTYPVISAAELPSFELVQLETPTDLNELGAKGIGESGTIGATPAVFGAVMDALAPFGVERLDMPATPMRVWRAVHEASRFEPSVTG